MACFQSSGNVPEVILWFITLATSLPNKKGMKLNKLDRNIISILDAFLVSKLEIIEAISSSETVLR